MGGNIIMLRIRDKIKKFDIDAWLLIWLLHFEEIKIKEYNPEYRIDKCVYVFNNYDEFKKYLLDNGCLENDEEYDLNKCIRATTPKGTIIAGKGECDFMISAFMIKRKEKELLKLKCDIIENIIGIKNIEEFLDSCKILCPEEFAEEIFDIMTNIIESQNIEQGLELCQDDEYVTTNPKKKIKSKK